MNVEIVRVNGNKNFSPQPDKNIFVDRKKIPSIC